MIRSIRKEGGGVQLKGGGLEGEDVSALENVKNVITEFLTVFEILLVSLPPIRSREHGIVLWEGSNPVRIRPYRYP